MLHSGTRNVRILVSTAVLLVAIGFLFTRVASLTLGYSEAFSIFHVSGSYGQVFDPDLAYPPGFYVILYWWMKLVGSQEIAVCVLAAFTGLIAVALMIQIGRRLHSWRAGWFAAFAVATSGYATYFLLELRATSIALMAIALLIWVHLLWLKRPSRLRSVIYALAITFALFMHYYIIFLVVFLGLHTLLTRWRLWWRWGLLSIFGGLLLIPLIPPLADLWNLFIGQRSGNQTYPSYMLAPFSSYIQAFSAHWDVVFAVILVVAFVGVILLMRRNTQGRAHVIWLALLGIGIPLFAYITRERLGLFLTRYLFYVILPAYALIGLGLAAAPRRVRVVGMAALFLLAFAPWQPFDFRPHLTDSPDVKAMVRYLNQHMEADDVLVIDPNCACGDPLIWWYYESTLTTHGIRHASANDPLPARVWYLVRQGKLDEDLASRVAQQRIETVYFGPWYFIATLHEGSGATQATYGDHIQLGRVEVTPAEFAHVSDQIAIAAWWSVDAPLDQDYSISLQVINSASGSLLTQIDSGPVGPYTPGQTSAWEPGKVYRDDRTVTLPFTMQGGEYDLRVIVYQSANGNRLTVTDQQGRQSDNFLIKQINVVTYNKG
ncbi:MAG: hypothetical protein GC204_18225 [Chloroflexi bacterium]|nr:hypothetical protein [Chloroflexota bacterium]